MNFAKFQALFLIVLIVGLPIYSADALAASVSITTNTGNAGVPQFLDGGGDDWVVQAEIRDTLTPVTPADVTIDIGGQAVPFTACSDGPLGAICEYISPLTEGIAEAEFQFRVVYKFINELGLADERSNGDVIKIDDSAPGITGVTARQVGDQIQLGFDVTDKVNTAPAVGLAQVDIINQDTGVVLQTIPLTGEREYSYRDGPLPFSSNEAGRLRLRVRATDRLGHIGESAIVSLAVDFAAPVVVVESLNFTQLGEFIGPERSVSDLKISIIEDNFDPSKVDVLSEQLEFIPRPTCIADDELNNLWHCTWRELVVRGNPVTLEFGVQDDFGNTAVTPVSQSFTLDASAPVVEFFGTSRTFDGRSYVSAGENTIILRVSESGVGIDERDIRANLRGLGGSEAQAPDRCVNTDTGLACFWDVRFSGRTDVVRMSLAKLQDRVGNEAQRADFEVFVDDSGPVVESLVISGGDHEYFQSNDPVRLQLEVVEASGLQIFVNLNDLVLDAADQFPENTLTRNFFPSSGWQQFSEQDCDRAEGKWVCTLETVPVKSGPEQSVALEVLVQDTAGNDAQNIGAWVDAPNFVRSGSRGKYRLELLGTQTEESPDYWETVRVTGLVDFIDLDTVKHTFTRYPAKVQLRTSNSRAKVLDMSIVPGGCVGAEGAPALSRALLYGVSGESFQLILEFSPFDGVDVEGGFEDEEFTYTCPLQIITQVGKQALTVPEIQNVEVVVPFAFSELGAIDQNLKEKVTDLKENELFKIAEVLAWVNTGITWAKYVLRIANVLVTVNQITTLVSTSFKASGDALAKSVAAKAAPSFWQGCLVTHASEDQIWDWLKIIEVPAQVLACNPAPFNPGDPVANIPAGSLPSEFYYHWQTNVLRLYNVVSGRDLVGFEANTLYENMYVSMAGLCVPGILYNIEKAREIYCRKIVCYAKEVPQGIATVDACDKVYDLQSCLYVWGPRIDFVPFVGVVGEIAGSLKAAVQSPLGLIKLSEIVACGTLCWKPDSSTWFNLCKISTVINKGLSIIDTLVSAFKSPPTVTSSPYCSQVDDIDVSKL